MSLKYNERDGQATFSCDDCGEESEFYGVSFNEAVEGIKDEAWAITRVRCA